MFRPRGRQLADTVRLASSTYSVLTSLQASPARESVLNFFFFFLLLLPSSVTSPVVLEVTSLHVFLFASSLISPTNIDLVHLYLVTLFRFLVRIPHHQCFMLACSFFLGVHFLCSSNWKHYVHSGRVSSLKCDQYGFFFFLPIISMLKTIVIEVGLFPNRWTCSTRTRCCFDRSLCSF